MKKLYHGSTYLFTEIDVDRGKGYKDFGRGFYATAVKEHAENLAKRNKRILERRQQVLKKKGIAFKNESNGARYQSCNPKHCGLSGKTFTG